ncbi:MAG TPA: hypothetical protein PKY77_06175 [Phycisphaerae bacterium]|nr:hypothetical protein [Phycisphaerae bacterium]HRY69558.1 hypothetical protein [Phycisphaerae bacterium]HSA29992.1 hypothetical protein [Phycisphaerae bacterium]
MTQLVARLILAMLILPVSACLFVLGFAVVVSRRPQAGTIALLYAGLYLFVACYWVLLWRSLVRWTPERIVKTILAGVVAVVAAAIAGGFLMMTVFGRSDVEVAMLIGGSVVPVIWVLATVIIWRETPTERAERLAKIGREAVSCPICGYNMTGLSEARCPECGTKFTLDQLIVSQPKADTHVLPEG